MEDEVWSYGLSSASSRSFQSTHKSQPEYFIEIDEFDGDEELDLGLDFPCPFCSEDFDLLELCYHIDEEHHSESKSGVCPVCAARVKKDMVAHITTQHLNVLKGDQKSKPYYKDEFQTHFLSRKELQDEQYRSGLGGRSSVSSASTSLMTLDPLLSFIHNTSPVEKLDKNQWPTSSEVSLEEKEEQESSKPTLSESVRDSPPLSEKDQEEKARRCKFVQGMLMSTFLNDDL